MTDQDLIDLLARENERLEVECERMRAVVEAAVDEAIAHDEMTNARQFGIADPENSEAYMRAYGDANRAALDANERFIAAVDAYRTPAPPAATSEEGASDE